MDAPPRETRLYLINQKLKTFWPDENKWFNATVKEVSHSHPAYPFHIVYADGDKEWVTFSQDLSTATVENTDGQTRRVNGLLKPPAATGPAASAAAGSPAPAAKKAAPAAATAPPPLPKAAAVLKAAPAPKAAAAAGKDEAGGSGAAVAPPADRAAIDKAYADIGSFVNNARKREREDSAHIAKVEAENKSLRQRNQTLETKLKAAEAAAAAARPNGGAV